MLQFHFGSKMKNSDVRNPRSNTDEIFGSDPRYQICVLSQSAFAAIISRGPPLLLSGISEHIFQISMDVGRRRNFGGRK